MKNWRFMILLIALPMIFVMNSIMTDADEIEYIHLDSQETLMIKIVGAPKENEVDLMITKTANGKKSFSIQQGDLLYFELNVKNIGKTKADNVIVRDYFDPSKTEEFISLPDSCELEDRNIYCQLGSLAAGQSATIKYTLAVHRTAPHGFMKMYANVSADGKELNKDNNSDYTNIQILKFFNQGFANLGAAHLNLQIDARENVFNGNWKTADSSAASARIKNVDLQEIQFKVKIVNSGNAPAYNVLIGDYFDSDTLSRVKVQDVVGAKWNPDNWTFLVPKVEADGFIDISYIAVFKRKNNGLLSGKSVAMIEDAQTMNGNIGESSLVSLTGIGKKDSAYIKQDKSVGYYQTERLAHLGGGTNRSFIAADENLAEIIIDSTMRSFNTVSNNINNINRENAAASPVNDNFQIVNSLVATGPSGELLMVIIMGFLFVYSGRKIIAIYGIYRAH